MTFRNNEEEVAFSRKYVYPKLSKAEFESVVALSEQYGLDITKGGYAVFDGKYYMTIYGMLQVALNNGLSKSYTANPLDIPQLTINFAGETYTVPEFQMATVWRDENNEYVSKVHFKEYATTVSHLNQPNLFLDKWALAMALRKGFADVLPNTPSLEEMMAGITFDDRKVGKLDIRPTEQQAFVQTAGKPFGTGISEDDPDVAAALDETTVTSIDAELSKMLETAETAAEKKKRTQQALEELFAVEAPY